MSGRNFPSGSLYFQDSYLGLGRLVRRKYAGLYGREWTLLGPDTENNDNYFGLDRFGRVDNLVLRYYTGEYPPHNHYQYTYNFNSQVTLREDLVGNVAGSYEFDESFAYDNLGRLIDHKRGVWTGGAMTVVRRHECWTQDRSANPTTYYDGTSSTCGTTYTATYNASNELSSWSLGPVAYDNSGNMKTKGSSTYTFDAWNRIRYSNGIGYHYYGNGQKSDGGGSGGKYFYNPQGQLIEERGAIYSQDLLLERYIWGPQHIDDLVHRTTEFMVQDANGSIVTRLDSYGYPVARHVYQAYGDPLQVSADWSTWQTITEDHHLFTGQQWQKDPANYDYTDRTQTPDIGRYMQRDPIGVWGDEESFGNGYLDAGTTPRGLLAPRAQQPPRDPTKNFDPPKSFEGDFKGTAPNKPTPEAAAIAVNLDIKFTWRKEELKETYRKCTRFTGKSAEAYASWDPTQSWFRPEAKTNALLFSHEVYHFKTAQMFAAEWNKTEAWTLIGMKETCCHATSLMIAEETCRAKFVEAWNRKRSSLKLKFEAMTRAYDKGTIGGTDAKKQGEWEKKIDKRLEKASEQSRSESPDRSQ